MSRRPVLVALDWLRPKDPRVTLGHASLHARLADVSGVEVVPVCHAVNVHGFELDALLADIIHAAAPGSEIAIGV